MNALAFAPMLVAILIAVVATFLYIHNKREEQYLPYRYGSKAVPAYVNLVLVYGICALISWISLPLMMTDPIPAIFHLIVLLGSYSFFSMSIFLAEEEEEIKMLEYYGLESGTKMILAVVMGVIGLGIMMVAGMTLTCVFNLFKVQQGSFLDYGMHTITMMETSATTATTSKFQQLLFVTLNATAEEFLMGVLAVIFLMMTVSKTPMYFGVERGGRSVQSRIMLVGLLVLANILIAMVFASLHFKAYEWSWEVYLQLAVNRLILTGLFCLWGFAERGSRMYWGIIACIVAHAGWNALLVAFGGSIMGLVFALL